MGKCKICMKESPLISNFLGLCLECIRPRPEKVLSIAKGAHALSRGRFDLVQDIPKGGRVQCRFCGYECEILEGSKGFCNLVRNEFYGQRRELPFLTASTLMVPGYIDEQEMRGIASFIAGMDEEIPYSLLAFFPHFDMRDLPLTKREDALRYQKIAKEAGLKNVRIGNVHLLS
jgi:uncharacterized Fe-S radical SAM superfamily protein PflX